MRIRIRGVTTLLAIGGASTAIAIAPSASAAPNEQTCADMGGSTQCERAGNVQIYTTLHPRDTTPNTTYGPMMGYHDGHI